MKKIFTFLFALGIVGAVSAQSGRNKDHGQSTQSGGYSNSTGGQSGNTGNHAAGGQYGQGNTGNNSTGSHDAGGYTQRDRQYADMRNNGRDLRNDRDDRYNDRDEHYGRGNEHDRDGWGRNYRRNRSHRDVGRRFERYDRW